MPCEPLPKLECSITSAPAPNSPMTVPSSSSTSTSWPVGFLAIPGLACVGVRDPGVLDLEPGVSDARRSELVVLLRGVSKSRRAGLSFLESCV